MIELWFILAAFSYFSFAISTSIDKWMMNLRYEIFHTNSFKMLFDGIILLSASLIFFKLNITISLFLWSLLLGLLYASSGIIYFKLLNIKDVQKVVPSTQALKIFFIFIGSIFLLNEFVNYFNYIGLFAILIGVYFVLSKKIIKIPRLDKGIIFIILLASIITVHSLLVKTLLSNIKPINLAIMMYFSTALFLFIYQLIFNKNLLNKIIKLKKNMPKILLASFFGALGTLLLYSALSIGNASKVYPMAGIQSVFVFIIAYLFLKEKFYWHRLFGTIAVFVGIFLVSI